MALVNKLKICTFNSNGSAVDRLVYINELFQQCDILLIQENWLYQDNMSIYKQYCGKCSVYGVSSMDQCELLSGRRFGGTAILWHSSTISKVKFIPVDNKNMCAMLIEVNDISILLCNLYMPFENGSADVNDKYENILNTVSSTFSGCEADYLVIGGDLNTNFNRTSSHHTSTLTDFIISDDLQCTIL